MHGPIGIVPGKEKLEKPTQIMMDHFVIKIASGNDHLVYVLPVTAQYTRTLAPVNRSAGKSGPAEYFCARGGRRGLTMLMCPNEVKCKSRHVKFCDISGPDNTARLLTPRTPETSMPGASTTISSWVFLICRTSLLQRG